MSTLSSLFALLHKASFSLSKAICRLRLNRRYKKSSGYFLLPTPTHKMHEWKREKANQLATDLRMFQKNNSRDDSINLV